MVTYDADGWVTEAEFNESGDSVGGYAFRKWGLALARSLRFKPETVAGHGMGSAMIPIIFCQDEETCPVLKPRPRLPGEGADLGGELVAKSVLQALPSSGS